MAKVQQIIGGPNKTNLQRQAAKMLEVAKDLQNAVEADARDGSVASWLLVAHVTNQVYVQAVCVETAFIVASKEAAKPKGRK